LTHKNAVQEIQNGREHAWIVWFDAEFFALISRVKFIVVAKTTTVDKLLTRLSLMVVEVTVRSAVTSANGMWQVTAI